MAERQALGVEAHPVASLNDLLEKRRSALGLVRNTEIALRGILRAHQRSASPIFIHGYPATVGLPHKRQSTGEITGYTEIACDPLIGDQTAEPRTIEKGVVIGVGENASGSSVSIRPEDAGNYWTFHFNNILELREAGVPEKSLAEYEVWLIELKKASTPVDIFGYPTFSTQILSGEEGPEFQQIPYYTVLDAVREPVELKGVVVSDYEYRHGDLDVDIVYGSEEGYLSFPVSSIISLTESDLSSEA